MNAMVRLVKRCYCGQALSNAYNNLGIAYKNAGRLSDAVTSMNKALNILLPSARRAAEWINRPNQAPQFGGRSALEVMLNGRVTDLSDVRRYLDGERGH